MNYFEFIFFLHLKDLDIINLAFSKLKCHNVYVASFRLKNRSRGFGDKGQIGMPRLGEGQSKSGSVKARQGQG